MSHPNDAPAAAWYPDPQTPGQVRWWDGTNWTEHVSTPTAQPAVESVPALEHATVQAAQHHVVHHVEVAEHTATITYIGRHAAGATPAPRHPSTAPQIRPRQRVEVRVDVPVTSPASVAEKLLSYA